MFPILTMVSNCSNYCELYRKVLSTGGYGDNGLPYDHIDNPYASLDDPFANQFYNDPKPAIYREYGAPLFNLRK